VIKICSSFLVYIYIAGCESIIKQAVSDFTESHYMCVNVRKTDYIYTGGSEMGVVIELINYAKSPKEPAIIVSEALELAHFVRERANQKSFTIMTPTKSYWYKHTENSTDN